MSIPDKSQEHRERDHGQTRAGDNPAAGDEVEVNYWYRVGDLSGETTIGTGDFGDKTVTFSVVNGVMIFEGDIFLGRVEDLHTPEVRGIGRTGNQFRWPGGKIPYVINPDLPSQDRVTRAIEHWHQHTRIRLVPRTNEVDYVEFIDDGGCYSQVGRVGGLQVISLGAGCSEGSAIHEIGHTVGLWHEQSREDRGKYIEVLEENIVLKARSNFLQHVKDGDDLGEYDFGSIMHYPPTAFSVNGQPTIKPKVQLPQGVVMGQRNGLSAGDRAAVQALYPELYNE